jgi:hypothetical protein
MMSKFTLLGTGVALLLGGLATSASAQTFNTSAASVTCNTVIGSVSIKPPISTASTGNAVIKVKATLGGCTSTDAAPSQPTIVSGSLSGTLNTSGAGGCAGLASPSTITGNLVAKWKLASGQKLDVSSTTASGGSITGGVFTLGGAFGTASYGQFTLSGQTLVAPSAFAGGTPSAVITTGADVGNLLGLCSSSPPRKGSGRSSLGLARSPSERLVF